MFRYTENKILEIFTKCVKTLVFSQGIAFSLLSRMWNWPTNAQWMFGLHVFSSSPCLAFLHVHMFIPQK